MVKHGVLRVVPDVLSQLFPVVPIDVDGVVVQGLFLAPRSATHLIFDCRTGLNRKLRNNFDVTFGRFILIVVLLSVLSILR